ncbi:MAG: hypothetical protein HC925_01375 [Coleofasciculaceae cyanobacterium SM2_3_26]|nr:hypothetical protein [Coleofasciculaceae cyanobacterium SM2_3_26]
MAKKKKRIITTKGFGFNQQKLDAGLTKFDRYFYEKRLSEAFAQLRALGESYRDHPDVLVRWCLLYQEVGDYQQCLQMCDRYLTVKPDDPEMLIMRGSACLSNFFIAAAVQTFRDLLQRYPNFKQADDVRKTIAEMQPMAEAEVEAIGLGGENGLELLALHEEAQIALIKKEYEVAHQLEERILEHHPGFPPALNSISQTHWLEGNVQQAIAVSQQVVEQHPDNVYALASLVEYYYLNGDEETARQYLTDFGSHSSSKTGAAPSG